MNNLPDNESYVKLFREKNRKRGSFLSKLLGDDCGRINVKIASINLKDEIPDQIEEISDIKRYLSRKSSKKHNKKPPTSHHNSRRTSPLKPSNLKYFKKIEKI